MKKFFTMLMVTLVATFVFCTFSASAATYGDLTYTVSNGEVTITGCNRNATEIVIPSTIESYPVTCIQFSAIGHCANLISVTIPSSVTSIEDWVFDDCKSLTSITVDENNQNYASYDGVLFNKAYTKLITYPAGKEDSNYVIPSSVISIKDYAFHNCRGLISVMIPNSTTNISPSAFCGCKRLTSITVDENNPNYTSYDGVLFNKAYTKLITYPAGKEDAEYIIPASVIDIEEYAFESCSALTSITIPDGETSIGWSTFESCTSLISVIIPNSVMNIKYGAFYGCTSLKNIYFTGTEEEWKSIGIAGGNESLLTAKLSVCFSATQTIVSEKGKKFTIIPIGILTAKTVIVALYDGDKFVETQTATYAGDALTFTTDKTYTDAKVMVWDNLTSLQPVCDAEIVK